MVKQIQKSPTAQNALLFNSFVRGIHEYFRKATHVNIEFNKIAFQLSRCLFNRLKGIARYEHPANAPPSYTKFYSTSFRTYKVAGVYLYPLANVRTSNNMNFSQNLTPYTEEGRELIHKRLQANISWDILQLMKSHLPKASVQYMDNRISRYSMRMGRCEITGWYLSASEVHCHHFIPKSLGGTDDYDNLRIIHREVHELIHMVDEKKIKDRLKELTLTSKALEKVNQYRRKVNLEPIVR